MWVAACYFGENTLGSPPPFTYTGQDRHHIINVSHITDVHCPADHVRTGLATAQCFTGYDRDPITPGSPPPFTYTGQDRHHIINVSHITDVHCPADHVRTGLATA